MSRTRKNDGRRLENFTKCELHWPLANDGSADLQYTLSALYTDIRFLTDGRAPFDLGWDMTCTLHDTFRRNCCV